MGRVAGDLLDAEVTVREARDLREVGDRDHLGARGQAPERLAHGVRGLAADAGVDLVEHHRLAAADRGDRECDSRELPARGGLGHGPERKPGVRPHREGGLVRAGGAGSRVADVDPELALAETDAGELGRNGLGEPWSRVAARGPELCVDTVDLGLPGGDGIGSCACGVVPLRERVELDAGLVCLLEELLVADGAVASAERRDRVETPLDLLDPSGLCLEGVEEPPQVDRDLAERQLDGAQALTGGGELGRDRLEGRDGALGGRRRGGSRRRARRRRAPRPPSTRRAPAR